MKTMVAMISAAALLSVPAFGFIPTDEMQTTFKCVSQANVDDGAAYKVDVSEGGLQYRVEANLTRKATRNSPAEMTTFFVTAAEAMTFIDNKTAGGEFKLQLQTRPQTGKQLAARLNVRTTDGSLEIPMVCQSLERRYY